MLGARGRQALLVLEDGSTYRGTAFAGEGEVLGEVVFNTGMSGYQEILTDPPTRADRRDDLPLIGNTGINPRTWSRRGSISRDSSSGSTRSTEQLALPRDPQGVPGAAWQARGRRNRHAGVDPADPDDRRDAGDPLH